MTATDDALDALKSISVQQIRSELDTLRAIRKWALANLRLDYKPGDKVVIVSDAPSSVKPNSGWYHHRETLRPGRIGTVTEIEFNSYHEMWQAGVRLDGAIFFMNVDWVQKAGEQQ